MCGGRAKACDESLTAEREEHSNIGQHTSPLCKINGPIIISINVREEHVQSSLADRHTGALEGRLQLSLIQMPVCVSIYAAKQRPQLLLGLLTESEELVIADLAVFVDIAGREHITDQRIGILERVVYLLEAELQRRKVQGILPLGVELEP